MMESNAFTTFCYNIGDRLNSKVIIKSNNITIEVDALWDTGATSSCISNDVIKKLSLLPVGRRNVMSASNSSVVNTYYIDVILPGCKEMFGLIASQANIEAQGLGMLIGMDIISQGDFAISNFNETTVFTFRSPSKATIDFVKEIVDEKEAK